MGRAARVGVIVDALIAGGVVVLVDASNGDDEATTTTEATAGTTTTQTSAGGATVRLTTSYGLDDELFVLSCENPSETTLKLSAESEEDEFPDEFP
jgi:hypothetical protein